MRHFIVPFSAAAFDGNTKGQAAGIFNASSASEINTWVGWANSLGAGVVNPELFYTKQLLDTIRFDADEYTYYRLADEMPIQDKADKLVVRRWSPLRAHTVPLTEGVPPQTDKGVAKKYEMTANAYGRYMEFSDRVDFQCVDSVMAHYANEYAIVAIETLDLLAQQELLAQAQKWFAGNAASVKALMPHTAQPRIEDFRLIGMKMKKAFVKPRSNGRYHAIVSPEFSFDMLNDPYVQSYMTINQSTYGFYDNAVLCPMFGFDFYEVNNCPQSVSFTDGAAKKVRVFIDNQADLTELTGNYTLASGWTEGSWTEGTTTKKFIYKDITISTTNATRASAYDTVDKVGIMGSRRTYGEFSSGNQSFIPGTGTGEYDYEAGAWAAIAADTDLISTSTVKVVSGGTKKLSECEVKVMTVQHTIIVGKDALVRTGMAGEGQAKMYTKALGSAGVLDPIDQRQSIGFKINSVGFCAGIVPKAVYDYVNIPTQLIDENVI